MDDGGRQDDGDDGVGGRTPLIHHPADQLGAAMNGQAGMSVGHEAFEHPGVASAPTPSLGGLLHG
jgi:hypothetical protein